MRCCCDLHIHNALASVGVTESHAVIYELRGCILVDSQLHAQLTRTAQVVQARDETVHQHKADPLGVRRPPDLSLHVQLPDWKVGTDASNLSLWSEIRPDRIAGDVRKLKSTYQFDTQRNHTFTRVRSSD